MSNVFFFFEPVGTLLAVQDEVYNACPVLLGGSIFDPNNMFVLIAIIYLDANKIFYHLDPSHVRW